MARNAAKHHQLARKLLDVSLSSPTVVGLRLGKVARGGLTPGRKTRSEIRRMGQEKMAAASEAWAAMAFAGMRLSCGLAALAFAAAWQPERRSPIDLAARASKLSYGAMLDGMNLGIEPYRKRARSNARRLARK